MGEGTKESLFLSIPFFLITRHSFFQFIWKIKAPKKSGGTVYFFIIKKNYILHKLSSCGFL